MSVNCGHCNKHHATSYDVYLCSRGEYNIAPRQAIAAPPTHEDSWILRTPKAMVENIRTGRYAVRPDSQTPYTFVRVSRPKHGKKKDCLVVQTQHSDWYKSVLVIRPDGRAFCFDRRIDSSLLLIVADPITASMAYGRELGVCCSCGRELTDERSRYYGIGPDCEQRFPEIILRVDDTRGQYRSGMS